MSICLLRNVLYEVRLTAIGDALLGREDALIGIAQVCPEEKGICCRVGARPVEVYRVISVPAIDQWRQLGCKSILVAAMDALH